jgi:hypothetical protein
MRLLGRFDVDTLQRHHGTVLIWGTLVPSLGSNLGVSLPLIDMRNS